MFWLKMPFSIRKNPQLVMLPRADLGHFLLLLTVKGEGLLDAFFPDGNTKDGFIAKALGITKQRALKLKQQLLRFRLISEDWQPLDWDSLFGPDAFFNEEQEACKESKPMTSTERSRKSRANKANATLCNANETPFNESATLCNVDATLCNVDATLCNVDATLCNDDATKMQRNDRCMSAEKTIENQQVTACNAPLKNIDLDLDLKAKSICHFRRCENDADGRGANPENSQIAINTPNLRNLADENIQAGFASDSDSNRLKTQNNAPSEPFNRQALDENQNKPQKCTDFQENTKTQQPHLALESPLFPEVQETPKVAANAALPPSSGAPPADESETRERCGKRSPPVPYQAIVDKYNQRLPELPQAVMLTPERKKSIQARWNAHPAHQDLGFWDELFEEVRRSDFLMGRTHNERNWRPNLDWLLNPRNFVKVVEGSYSQGNQ